jgi:hypothetical protein
MNAYATATIQGSAAVASGSGVVASNKIEGSLFSQLVHSGHSQTMSQSPEKKSTPLKIS